MLALADNVRRLKQHRGWGLVELARRAGVSKSALGYLINYKDRNDRHPTMETVEGVARAFDLELWQLMVPDLPLDMLESHTFARMIENYRDAPPSGRAMVERIAESEVKYAVAESVLSGSKKTGTRDD